MKFSILLTVLVLACNFTFIFGYPGIVESNIDLKKFQREKNSKNSEPISTKLPSSYNNNSRNSLFKEENNIETFNPTSASFQPIKFSREDVLNSIHSSYGPSTSSPSQSLTSSGGVIFAISRGHESTSSPLLASADISEFSAGQPVLMQYLSPEGERKTAVSYIQLLRPIMMVPAQPYHPSQTISIPIKSTTTTMRPFTFFPRDDAPYAAALTSDFMSSSESTTSTRDNIHKKQQTLNSQQEIDIDLNMNEYIPAASTQSFSSVPPPSYVSQYSQYRISPQSASIPQFRRFAQRA